MDLFRLGNSDKAIMELKATFIDNLNPGAPTILTAVIVICALLFYCTADERPYPGIPVVGKGKREWTNKKAKERFQLDATQILKQGLLEHKGPFQVFAPHGPTIILPPSMIDSIRNDDRLVFTHASRKIFLGDYSGLDPFRLSDPETDILIATVRQNLTQSLGGDTPAALASSLRTLLATALPPPATWTPIAFAQLAPAVAARLSAQVFLGEPLCRDAAWLAISVSYTLNAMAAVRRLRSWPPPARALLQHLVPECRALRAQIAHARRLIEPEVEARGRARKGGRAVDALGWMEEQGVRRVLMNRVALEAFNLPDGTRVPKGAMVGIPTWHMQDASNFEDPDKFDGERFLRMRQIPGLETRAQFVTTSADHLGFGHGKHACPGRFFASNELKIALCYLLMNYDWKFEEGEPKRISLLKSEFMPDPQQKILVRAREPELDLFKL
ncbi:putative cytochrome p450 protein [Neofusicoccum parvum UCRNP2]|uniref:Putative cytochrome p450 protein n=1 Tax=Botryosphaeria parva (strain UCR-NP2) TaxID=1287680 RepID=R1GJU5_BOTPV|nr:putative cytochrome p450 protein [Neofusicoccum parvum UCRNP2]